MARRLRAIGKPMSAVVDSCGWLEYIANGSNASFFESALQNEAQLLVPQIVVFEVCKRLLILQQDHAVDSVLQVMERCKVADLNTRQMLLAAQAAQKYKLTMADAIIWQTAQVHKAALYTQDADLKALPGVQYKAKIPTVPQL